MSPSDIVPVYMLTLVFGEVEDAPLGKVVSVASQQVYTGFNFCSGRVCIRHLQPPTQSIRKFEASHPIQGSQAMKRWSLLETFPQRVGCELKHAWL